MSETPLTPGGGLAAHEAAGASTLARHVGVPLDDLRSALTPRTRRASSFASRAVAEGAVSETLVRCAGRVQAWLRGGAAVDLDLHLAAALPVGMVVTRDGVASGDRVLVVLRRAESRLGYRVAAAYPLAARPPASGAENVAAFFAAYFHQDWALADPPPMRLAARFARAARPATVDAVTSEIDRLLLQHRDPDELRARLDELDLEYDPAADGQTCRAWLFEVRERMSAEIVPPSRGAAFAARLD